MTGPTVSKSDVVNQNVGFLDDNRRKLGIASLHGKIKACMVLLKFADRVCEQSAASYDDPAQTDAHLYSCLESIYTVLEEATDHARVGMALCTKVVGDNNVPPLDKFAATMRKENGLAQ